MNEKEYLQELTRSIPVTSSLDIEIHQLTSTGVSLKAPLNTHINYEGTAFGGSLNTLCVLAGYLSVHHMFRSKKISFDSLVIQNSSINYLKPVTKDFMACAEIQNPEKVIDHFQRRSKARAELNCTVTPLETSQEILCKFTARFVISSR